VLGHTNVNQNERFNLNATKFSYPEMSVVSSPTKQARTVTYTVPIDPSILEDIERDSGQIAKEVEDMMRRLEGRMNDVSLSKQKKTPKTKNSVGVLPPSAFWVCYATV
jgi:hypothetical protein